MSMRKTYYEVNMKQKKIITDQYTDRYDILALLFERVS